MWQRWAVAVHVIGFTVGTVLHVVDLARGGLDAYSSFSSGALEAFFLSLVLLDPLVVVLLLLARRAGVLLACAVLLVDLAANWWVVGQPPWTIAVFTAFVLTCAIPLWRAPGTSAAPGHRGGPGRRSRPAP